jgi:hypothetical protein
MTLHLASSYAMYPSASVSGLLNLCQIYNAKAGELH